MAETAKAHDRRVRERFFDRYVKAPVLDIGAGDDPLTPDCDKWDSTLGNGDASLMAGAKEDYYNTIYASHILEHLPDPVLAIQNWWRLVRPGGHLIIVVPSRDLYEKKKELPSQWNGDHKHFYNLLKPEGECTRGLLDDVLMALGTNACVVKCSVEDSGWVDVGPEKHSVGEYSLEAVIKKPEPKCMKLAVFTIVLNGMPWIPAIFTVLNSLKLDWHWYVVEGAALNVSCSKHCQPLEPQLSTDGTAEFMAMLKNHPRVTFIQQALWQGKIEMVNEAVSQIKDHCVLMQMDADEIWTAEHIGQVYSLLATQQPGSAAQFYCRYFVGPHLFTSEKDTYGNYGRDWIRAWRFSPGQKFVAHCPPIMEDQHIVFDRDQTALAGITFEHYSWVTEAQTVFKTGFYKYGSTDGWKQLQSHTEFPTSLKPFMAWADEKASVNSL